LASIHTIAALPFLAALLDGPDPALRVEAIGGLGAFANGLPIQTTQGIPSLSYLQPGANAPYRTSDTVRYFVMGNKPSSRTRRSIWLFGKTGGQNSGSA
jgi:hypothetical protein